MKELGQLAAVVGLLVAALALSSVLNRTIEDICRRHGWKLNTGDRPADAEAMAGTASRAATRVEDRP